jgi:hypothetical protein
MPAPRIAADARPQAAPRAIGQPNTPLWKRLAWMAAIWAASVAALGAVAWVLELWIRA